jgi:hypothetical protein
LTASAENVAALGEVEAADYKNGPILLKGCRVLGVEVKTVDVAIAAKIVAGTATLAERLAAAEKLLDDHKAEAYARVRGVLDSLLIAHWPGDCRQSYVSRCVGVCGPWSMLS